MTSHEEEINKFRKQSEAELTSIQKDFQNRVFNTRDRYEKLLQEKLKNIVMKATTLAVGIATLVVLGVVTFLYSGLKDVNQAVLQLKQILVSTYNHVRTTTTELENAKKSAANANSASMMVLKKAGNDMEIASKNLNATQKLYDERLQSLRAISER